MKSLVTLAMGVIKDFFVLIIVNGGMVTFV